MLTPAAGQLLLALALVLQGGGAVFPVKAPDRLERWRLGAVGTSAAGLFILAFGDGIQFVVLALAARSAAPWLALVGAVIGSLAVLAPAALVGEREWTRAPLGPIRVAIGVVFVLAGLILGLAALHLV
jgi:putative Ca2+/H+ antiporter (TMEM165/GDT1 family)